MEAVGAICFEDWRHLGSAGLRCDPSSDGRTTLQTASSPLAKRDSSSSARTTPRYMQRAAAGAVEVDGHCGRRIGQILSMATAHFSLFASRKPDPDVTDAFLVEGHVTWLIRHGKGLDCN